MPLPTFTDDGTRLAHTFNGLTLNDPDDPDDDYYEITDAPSQTSYEAITDPLQNRDGLEAYDARKIARTILIRGVVRAPTLARLYDKIEALAVAFDPALGSLNNPTVNGFLAYDFSVPTADLTTYPDGLIPSRYYARALKPPDPIDSRNIGTSQFFEMTLLCRDPRRYLQSTVTLAGAGTLVNTKADYISWPTITITMSGAGSATYRVNNTTLGQSIWLDLSGRSNADIVIVDVFNQTVSVNGTTNDGLIGASTAWWYVPAGNSSLTITNGTNASTSCVFRPSFVI